MYIISFAATTTYVIYTNEVIWFLTRIKYDIIFVRNPARTPIRPCP